MPFSIENGASRIEAKRKCLAATFKLNPYTAKVGPGILGAGLFLVFAPVHLLFEENVSVAIPAITLALIGGPYISFNAVLSLRPAFWVELAVAALDDVTALFGVL